MYNKTRPGLVALYDIRPGNGEGLFLQPRSPHGAVTGISLVVDIVDWITGDCWALAEVCTLLSAILDNAAYRYLSICIFNHYHRKYYQYVICNFQNCKIKLFV